METMPVNVHEYVVKHIGENSFLRVLESIIVNIHDICKLGMASMCVFNNQEDLLLPAMTTSSSTV